MKALHADPAFKAKMKALHADPAFKAKMKALHAEHRDWLSKTELRRYFVLRDHGVGQREALQQALS